MAVFRVEKTKAYTVMSNHHLHNKKLSFKAKGLMSFMLSLPENWNYTERGLAHFAKDGRDSIRAALSELEAEGYLQRKQHRNKDGTLAEMEYIIYEQPYRRSTLESVENAGASPWSENPLSEKPMSEKATIQNTNRQKTEKENTYYSYNLSAEQVKEEIKKQIGYDDLINTNSKELVNNILQITLELDILSRRMAIVNVGQTEYPADLVQMKLSQLTYFHIEYVISCMENHKDKIKNIKAYLQKSILNAPDTMDAYYQAEVKYDMRHRSD